MRGPRQDPPDWRALVGAHLDAVSEPVDDGVLDELSQHLGDLYDEAIALGRSHDEALALARAALPIEPRGLAKDVERARRALPSVIVDRWAAHATEPLTTNRGGRLMADWRRDLVHAVRQLVRAPGYTLAVAATLALGIGASTAIVAAVDTMLLRPMPYANADRLVVPVSENAARDIHSGSVTWADYEDWNRETSIFDAVALMRPVSTDLEADQPERIEMMLVTQEFAQVVPVTPVLGRMLHPSDYVPGASAVAVLAHGVWLRAFGGQSDIAGRTVKIGGRPVEIVGVMPASRVWPDGPDVFIPMLTHYIPLEDRQRRDNMIFFAVASLREGVSVEQADAVLAGIAARLEREAPEARAGWTNRIVPLRQYIVSAGITRSLWLLLAAVAAVLLIGCINLANLALVRGLLRAREVGVRIALGASRWRVARQQLAESLVLSLMGAAGGLAVAALLMRGLVAMAPPDTPLVDRMAIDPRVLAATAALTLVALVLAGLVPALAVSRLDPGVVLKDGAPAAGSSRRVRFLRHALSVVQVAGAIILLTGAALLARSYWRLQQVDPGLDLDHVLTARISLPNSRYSSGAHASTFYQSLVDRLDASPGVEAAAATSFVPVGGGGFGLGRVFLTEGQAEPPASQDVGAQWNVITPGYFRTMGIPVLEGRTFTGADRSDSVPVVIVSRSFARRMFGDADPIGKRIRSWRDENVYREVVGVVGEVRYRGLAELTELRQIYVPHTQNTWGFLSVVVRSAGASPAGLEPLLRNVIQELDSALPVSHVATLRTIAGNSVAEERYATLVLSLLAATALALGAVGLYGVMGHAVSMRVREFGVRSALGGSPRHLYALVLGEGLRLTAIGVGIGLAGALAASRVFETLLYETTPRDPEVYALTTLAIVIVASAASFLPARRAARVDPLTALKSS